MASRNMCLSISTRNEDKVELIEEYADIFGRTKSDTVFFIVEDWNRLKMKERLRELEGVA